MASDDPRNGRPRSLPGWIVGPAAAALWILGLWTTGIASSLGRPATAALTLCGLPLIALLLGIGGRRPGWLREGGALAVPLGTLWILNRRALGFWWMGDDPCHLVQVLDHGIWRPFVDSVGYFLTPLLNFSLGMDFELFGLEPRAFYAHQLVSFSVLLGVGYAFLRNWLEPAFAGLALTLFVATAPAVAVAQQQMNRHYLEGFVLLLASFALYRRSLAAERPWPAVLGAALYLLAAAAKEVFVPLVLLLPFLAPGGPQGGDRGGGDWRDPGGRWWRHAVPYGLALGFYGFWRLAMLGWDNSLSAYGALAGHFHGGVLLHRVPRLLGLIEPWQGLAAAAVLATAGWIVARRSQRFMAGTLVTLALLALPLIPVAGRLEPRHLFLASFGGATVVAAALQDLPGGLRPAARTGLRALIGTGLLVPALFAAVASPVWAKLEDSSRLHRTEGRFLLDGSRTGTFLTTIRHSHHLHCLERLAREGLGRTAGAGFCGDLCYCSRAFPGEVFWDLSGSAETVEAPPEPESCDAGRPLRIDMRHDVRRERLSWRLGPYDDGAYEALLILGDDRPGVGFPIPIPRQGEMPYRLIEPLRFVLKYRSPEGWQTYSRVQVVEPGGRARSFDGHHDS